MLALSPKQRDKFGKWMRPDSLCEHPQMIYAISSFSIRQARHFWCLLLERCLLL